MSLPVQEKTCTACHETKNLDDFHHLWSSLDKRQPRCKECVAAYDAIRNSDPVRISHRNFMRRTRDYGFHAKAEEFGLTELIEAHGPGCKGCGIEGVDFIIHHRVPVSLGGEHTIENTMRLCSLCNASVTALERAWVRTAEWSDIA